MADMAMCWGGHSLSCPLVVAMGWAGHGLNWQGVGLAVGLAGNGQGWP